MKSDLITIFNRLTSSELADCDLFFDILENHYEKFRYIYSLIESINLSKVDKIYCETKNDELKVIIEPDKISYINTIIYNINDNKNNYIFSDYFNLNIIEKHSLLEINIKIKDNKKEGDLYDSRFI